VFGSRPVIRASTLNTYVNILETDLRPMWGDEAIRRLTRDDVGDYRARLTDQAAHA
jgi:hypothetical protein